MSALSPSLVAELCEQANIVAIALSKRADELQTSAQSSAIAHNTEDAATETLVDEITCRPPLSANVDDMPQSKGAVVDKAKRPLAVNPSRSQTMGKVRYITCICILSPEIL